MDVDELCPVWLPVDPTSIDLVVGDLVDGVTVRRRATVHGDVVSARARVSGTSLLGQSTSRIVDTVRRISSVLVTQASRFGVAGPYQDHNQPCVCPARKRTTLSLSVRACRRRPC
jgi:hypothetical protein